jgi:hypothetical protein
MRQLHRSNPPVRRLLRPALLLGACLVACVADVGSAHAQTGTLHVSFLYMPPGTVHPTYHTAIWLEDGKGKLVKTLYVTSELSSSEYLMGEACPDWVKQAHWDKADKAVVDAVTGPTPNVGIGALAFDLGALGVAEGAYQFKFQVHITEQYNVLYTGSLNAGASPQDVVLEVRYSSAKPAGVTEFIRQVQARYVPAGQSPHSADSDRSFAYSRASREQTEESLYVP